MCVTAQQAAESALRHVLSKLHVAPKALRSRPSCALCRPTLTPHTAPSMTRVWGQTTGEACCVGTQLQRNATVLRMALDWPSCQAQQAHPTESMTPPKAAQMNAVVSLQRILSCTLTHSTACSHKSQPAQHYHAVPQSKPGLSSHRAYPIYYQRSHRTQNITLAGLSCRTELYHMLEVAMCWGCCHLKWVG